MEDHRRPLLVEHLAHARGVLAVGEHRRGAREVALLLELAADLEQRVLGVLDEHQPARPHARDLARELGADRAAGAGHEHHAPAQVGAHAVDLHAHRLAAEHVLHAHLAHLAHEVHAAGEQLEGRGQRAHRDAAVAAGGHDLLAQDARGGGDRDDHLVGLDVVEHARELVGRAEHLVAGHAHALLARVVVHEAHRRRAQARVAAQLEGHLLAAVAGAHDQHLARGALEERARAAAAPRARATGSASR